MVLWSFLTDELDKFAGPLSLSPPSSVNSPSRSPPLTPASSEESIHDEPDQMHSLPWGYCLKTSLKESPEGIMIIQRRCLETSYEYIFWKHLLEVRILSENITEGIVWRYHPKTSEDIIWIHHMNTSSEDIIWEHHLKEAQEALSDDILLKMLQRDPARPSLEGLLK